VLIAFAVLIVLIVAPSQAADKSPFVGHWEGINEIPDNPELGDDSRMIINISVGPQGTVSVFYTDFGASACGLDPEDEPLYAAQAKWIGVISENTLSVYGRGGPGIGNGALWCMANPPFMLTDSQEEPTPFVTYDPVTDTLSDGYDYLYRAGRS
jgi:hypothetical protein